MDYKAYSKELRDSAKKLDLSGLAQVAEEYRKSASAIEELVKRNDIQKEIILEKMNVIAGIESYLHKLERSRLGGKDG